MATPQDPRPPAPGTPPSGAAPTPGSVPGEAPQAPPTVQQINVRTEPAPQSGGGATAVIVGIVALIALLAVVYFVFLNGETSPTEVDVNLELPEVQAPEMPDINIEVPEIEVPDVTVEVPEVLDGDDATDLLDDSCEHGATPSFFVC